MARGGVGSLIEVHKIMTGKEITRDDLIEYSLITSIANKPR